MRQEVKANELVKGSGPWASLPYGDKVRKRIFRSFMRLQGKVGTVQTFDRFRKLSREMRRFSQVWGHGRRWNTFSPAGPVPD